MDDYIWEVDYTSNKKEYKKKHKEFVKIVNHITEVDTNEDLEEKEKNIFVIDPKAKSHFDNITNLMLEYCRDNYYKGKCVISREKKEASFSIYLNDFFEIDNDVGINLMRGIADNADYFVIKQGEEGLIALAKVWIFY